MAVAALVLGILATISPFLLLFSANFVVFAIPLALVALLLGIVARRGAIKRSQPTGLATASVVMGVVPLLISAAMLVIYSRSIDSAKEFSAKDPAQLEKLRKDRIKNGKEFDDLFNKALQQDQKTEDPKDQKKDKK